MKDLDSSNPVVKLCIEGMKAEVQGRHHQAGQLFLQAWNARQNDLDACVAAHYLARQQATPEAQLHWNQVALNHAEALDHDEVQAFYPSLYLNLGKCHEVLGNRAEACRCYERAAISLEPLPDEACGEHVRVSIGEGFARTQK